MLDKLDEFEGVIEPILGILCHPEVSKHLESFK